MGIGDRVNVDAVGRALLTFADFLRVEVFRDGDVLVRQVPDVGDASPFVRLFLAIGSVFSRLTPEERAAARVTIDTDFATIESTSTEFLVTHDLEAGLTWVVGFDGEAQVTADGTTKPIEREVARWVAATGSPSPGIKADMDDVWDWYQADQVDRTLGQVILRCRVTASALNIRSGPSTDFAKIDESLPRDTSLGTNYKNPEGTWYEVFVPSRRQTGWVSVAFLDCVMPPEAVPEHPSAPPTPTATYTPTSTPTPTPSHTPTLTPTEAPTQPPPYPPPTQPPYPPP